jgi:hypothetical protein
MTGSGFYISKEIPTCVIDGSFASWLPVNIFSISFLPELPGSLMAVLPHDFPLTYFQSVSYPSHLGHWWQFCLMTSHLHIFNQFLTWVTWVIDGSFAQWLPINIFSISFLPESPGSLMAALPNDFPLTYFQSVSYLSGLGHWWQFCLHTNHSSFADDSINTL